jgi:S1-C subfamily serine protease
MEAGMNKHYCEMVIFAVCMVMAGCARQESNAAISPLPAPKASILELESEVEAVYQRLEPSVANITSKSVTYDMFSRPVPQEGTGSGFVYDNQGHIITNYHVVENAQTVTVNFGDGKVFTAQVAGSDPSNDLAVLKIDDPGLPPPVVMGDSAACRVGQFVVALGNPFGLTGTLTFGVISALGRTIRSPDNKFIGEAIQVDAPINPGNSGGPLINLKGEVIGINSQIISPSGSSAGIGFAVSAATVKRVVPQLISSGKYRHPAFGIAAVDFTAEWKDFFSKTGFPMPIDRGILVVQVMKDSPADKMNLLGGRKIVQVGGYRLPMGGDIIIAVDNNPVATLQELVVYIEINKKVGDTIEITYFRGNQKMSARTVLTEQPAQ